MESEDPVVAAAKLPANWNPSVDVFITSYNETLEILESTIEAALAIEYPVKIYVLDDGRRDWLKEYCTKVNVHYITRATNQHQKAGNVNNAIGLTTGDFFSLIRC